MARVSSGSTTTTTTTTTTTSPCCSPELQSSCCEPPDTAACCGAGAADGSCGCSEGHTADGAPERDVREIVRGRYAEAARALSGLGSASCGCAPLSSLDVGGTEVFGRALYDGAHAEGAPVEAVQASLGCGVPTDVAELQEGETVLDLGSGAGADVLISARRVGAEGKVIGLDMTDEMLELARANAERAGIDNVEFLKGYIEELPLPDASVDVVISNCVLNLAADKQKVLAEVARVLRTGGRLAISDIIAHPDMDDATRADVAQWTGCIAGALTDEELRSALADAGLIDVEVRPTHRVHEHAEAAIIRARKPEPSPAAAYSPVARRLELYEPAMCCQTGVCGPSVDQQLIDVREHLRWAESQGAQVSRHNLSSDPDAFVSNPKVTGLMAAFGEPALPMLLVDGDIAIHGRYPSRSDLEALLEAEAGSAAELPQSSGGCGCGPGGC